MYPREFRRTWRSAADIAPAPASRRTLPVLLATAKGARVTKSVSEAGCATRQLVRAGFLCATILGAACGSGPSGENGVVETVQAVLDATYFQYPLGPTSAGYTVAQWNTNNATQTYFYFGSEWKISNAPTCGGKYYLHTGRDAPATAGDPVWAVANGRVVGIESAGSGWGSIILIEHYNVPGIGTVVSNYTHTVPVSSLAVGQDVTKGKQIATVFNVSPNHLHFGIWQAGYVANQSDKGALPQYTGCGYPVFPASFVNPDNFISAHNTCSPACDGIRCGNADGCGGQCGCAAGYFCSGPGSCVQGTRLACPTGTCDKTNATGWCGVGFYCGSSGLSGAQPNTLYYCTQAGGYPQSWRNCGEECHFRPGLDDQCWEDSSNCSYWRAYNVNACGWDYVNGNPRINYHCYYGSKSIYQWCAAGRCAWGSINDYCY